MKYKDEMEVMFWHGTNRDGVTATHQSNLRVEIASPPIEHGLARISIEHTREDVCPPPPHHWLRNRNSLCVC